MEEDWELSKEEYLKLGIVYIVFIAGLLIGRLHNNWLGMILFIDFIIVFWLLNVLRVKK